MAYSDLRDFIEALEKKKELKRISFEVDPFLEITEFADRAVKQGGPALLFEKPKGYSTPVLINAFASMRKMELARAMATRPKLLISDEAMAGLSGSEVDEVLDLLIKLAGESITIIMIEHIMQAVMRFSERIMCLDAGKIIAIGQPSDVMANARVQEAYLGT